MCGVWTCEVVEVCRRGSTCRRTHQQRCWAVVAVLRSVLGSLQEQAVQWLRIGCDGGAFKQDVRSV